jgi:hypothetical protein
MMQEQKALSLIPAVRLVICIPINLSIVARISESTGLCAYPLMECFAVFNVLPSPPPVPWQWHLYPFNTPRPFTPFLVLSLFTAHEGMEESGSTAGYWNTHTMFRLVLGHHTYEM